ncbi:hypothetical protein [Streptomyces phytohabitans]|uniref:hypothetical protein n=1 Tax=Streptomyces phytohabitans TaxID=1150371 RepID=UPI00345BADDF
MGEVGPDVFVPPRAARRWWLRAGVALAVAGVLVAGGLKAYDEWFVRCADGVRERGPDSVCVGVTDGTYVFGGRPLADVSARIAAENRRVAESGRPWVSVAYTEPLTRGPGDRGAAAVQQALQGAYLAQRELNSHGRGGRGTLPQIRLLLANSGPGGAYGEELAAQLGAMADDGSRPLVGVAGFGQSTEATGALVAALRERGVPMVGATVAADELASATKPGFYRVSSPNADQSAASARYLAERQRDDAGFRVAVVKDRKREDSYSASLREGFASAAARRDLEVRGGDLSYDSSLPGVENALASIADKICERPRGERPDAVFFAGRGPQLRAFIEAAGSGGRRCPTTVLSGSSAVGLYFGIRDDEGARAGFTERWAESGVKVRYTAFTHPEVPAEAYAGGDADPYPGFRRSYLEQRRFGGEAGLRSGQAMQGHDAVLALGWAIRAAASETGTEHVGPGEVLQMLDQLDALSGVRGVAGPIAFDDAGNPVGKLLALVEMDPRDEGAYRYVRSVRP